MKKILLPSVLSMLSLCSFLFLSANNSNKDFTPSATFDKLWIDYDVYDNGIKGMKIFCWVGSEQRARVFFKLGPCRQKHQKRTMFPSQRYRSPLSQMLCGFSKLLTEKRNKWLPSKLPTDPRSGFMMPIETRALRCALAKCPASHGMKTMNAGWSIGCLPILSRHDEVAVCMLLI